MLQSKNISSWINEVFFLIDIKTSITLKLLELAHFSSSVTNHTFESHFSLLSTKFLLFVIQSEEHICSSNLQAEKQCQKQHSNNMDFCKKNCINLIFCRRNIRDAHIEGD